MSTVKRVSGDYTIETINAGDLVTLSSTNVNIVGNLTVTGNAVLAGNINADKIFNGTTSIEIPVINGNANVTIGATSNVVVWATTGEYVTGIISASGNVTGSNVNTSGLVTATGNVTGANLTTAGNVWISRDASVAQPTIRFTDTDTDVADGQVFGAIEWFTNDLSGARVTSAIKSVASSTQGNALVQIFTSTNGAAATAKVTVDNVGNVGIANAAPLHALAVSGTIYGSSTLTAIGNVTGGNIATAGLVTVTGNVTGGNLITAGLATVTGNITGGNVISLGAVSAGAAGMSATGNIKGGNILSDDAVSATGNMIAANFNATQNFSTTGNVRSGTVTASGNIVGANVNVTGNSYGTGIGVENVVWQPTTVNFNSAIQANVGTLGFFVLGGYTYKFEAYMPVLPSGDANTGFSTYFDAGTCYYTVEAQTTQTSAFNTSTSNVSGTAAATQAMTGTTSRAVRITGTIYSAGNANVTVQAQTDAAIGIQSGSYLTYTRLS
jgi:filamentous hemagglutinin